MRLEDQVSSLGPSKRLKELGVKQKSVFSWVKMADGSWLLYFKREIPENVQGMKFGHDRVSAFTVAELGEKLPPIYRSHRSEDGRWWADCGVPKIGEFTEAETEADARAKMLIYLIENKLLSAR